MAVSGLLSAIFLLLFQARSKMTLGYKEKDFFTACPHSYCRKGGPEIRYPFRLQSSPPYCGALGLVLSCLGNDTLLSLPESGSYKVVAIEYRYSEITIKLGDPWSDCEMQNFSSTSLTNLTTPVYTPHVDALSLVNCSKEWISTKWYSMRPISCLSGADHFVYMADIDMPMVLLPLDCVVVSTNLVIPEWRTGVQRGEVLLTWNSPEIGDACTECEWNGGRCKFDWTINQASCSFPEQHGELPYSFLLWIVICLRWRVRVRARPRCQGVRHTRTSHTPFTLGWHSPRVASQTFSYS